MVIIYKINISCDTYDIKLLNNLYCSSNRYYSFYSCTYLKEARLFSKFRKLGVDARIYTDGHLLPEVLNNNGVPMIALTNIVENDLSHLVNASLYVSTREKSYKKNWRN